MKIALSTDHAGYERLKKLKEGLELAGYSTHDFGPAQFNIDDDYPDFIIPCTKAVVKDKGSMGIILGGSGQGEQITANKVPGIRAIEYYGGNLEIVKLGREHNNANILSLGARFMTVNEAREAVNIFISTQFSGDERHIRRINKIEK
jgi:ribose 5-phosphate isomerase B